MLLESQLKNLKTLDSICFRGKSHFVDNDCPENYLVFQPIYRSFKMIANTKYISEWKSKTLSDGSIKAPATSDTSLSPLVDYFGNKIRLKFNGSCLKQNKLTYTQRTIVNIYTVYEMGASSSFNDHPKLKNSLFGAVKLTKNTDFDKNRYSGYGIGFDRKGIFSFPGGRFGQNAIMFGADMSSSAHVYNKKKYILIPGKGPTQGLGELSLTEEEMYLVNFIVTRNKFCLSVHCNGANGYLFVNGTEIIKFKAKDSGIVAILLCLGNISNNWSVDNMKTTGFNGYIYGFSVDYDAIAVNDFLDIHKYLMKKKK